MTQTSSLSDELLKSCRDSIAILKKYVPWFEANKGIDHGPAYEDLVDKNGRKCGICYIGDNLDRTFSEFLDAVDDSPFYDLHYNITIKRLFSQYPHIINAVPAATLQESCALLTYLIRGEHFCDGFHQEAVENGSFLLVIKRIIEIVETESQNKREYLVL